MAVATFQGTLLRFLLASTVDLAIQQGAVHLNGGKANKTLHFFVKWHMCAIHNRTKNFIERINIFLYYEIIFKRKTFLPKKIKLTSASKHTIQQST